MMVFERLSWRVTFKCPSPASCQKRFLWTHKKVDLALHPVVGLVLQVEYTDTFSHALAFQSRDPFFSESASRVHVQEDGGDKRLVALELVCRAGGVAPPDPV